MLVPRHVHASLGRNLHAPQIPKSPNPQICRGHSLCANTVGFGTFPGFYELLVQCAKISSRWGGYVYTF